MLENLITTIETTSSSLTVTNESFAVSSAVSVLLGAVIGFTFSFKQKRTKGFILALTILPLIVQVVIMMVNGNIGTGVAVMGAFSLVRFRSVPGNAKDICGIFLAMAVGLATGSEQIVLACVVTAIVCAITLIFTVVPIGGTAAAMKELHITIPESLDYSEVFDDIFEKYTTHSELISTKTTGMGSLYKLSYDIKLKDVNDEKKMIDELRCRNGNLEITCAKKAEIPDQL
ncbi:MAG: DUF4956 domain-containing protein [Ruminococcus sp.]|nr:DUF4956 domain-containing protein [Ruminococcus sp.]